MDRERNKGETNVINAAAIEDLLKTFEQRDEGQGDQDSGHGGEDIIAANAGCVVDAVRD